MNIETKVYERLLSDPSIAEIVEGRIYPVFPEPNSITPYIAYRKTDTEAFGTLTAPATLFKYGFAIDYWAVQATVCTDLGELIKSRLSGWTDSEVQLCTFVEQSQAEEAEGFHGEMKFYIFANL